MSTAQATRPAKQKPWRSDTPSTQPVPPSPLIGRYLLLIFVVIISIGPFLWQLSTSLKSVNENIYSFPPHLIPQEFTIDAYRRVAHVVPILRYAWHSVIVAAVCVVGNVVLASLAGYALTCMKFRGKKVVMGILLSVLLLPGEVTLTSQYLVIKGMGLANTLTGVAIPGVVGAINVLLMATACRAVPPSVLDAATVDGANTCRRFATSYGPTSRAWPPWSRCSRSSGPGTTFCGHWLSSTIQTSTR